MYIPIELQVSVNMPKLITIFHIVSSSPNYTIFRNCSLVNAFRVDNSHDCTNSVIRDLYISCQQIPFHSLVSRIGKVEQSISYDIPQVFIGNRRVRVGYLNIEYNYQVVMMKGSFNR